MSQRGSQSSGSDSDSHFEQLMVNMLDERDRLLDTLRETQESLSLAQQRLQDVIYDRDSLQRQLNSALPQSRSNAVDVKENKMRTVATGSFGCCSSIYYSEFEYVVIRVNLSGGDLNT
ncbi:hypothetical protein TURU_122170 [Turdus rufiventris]|nr:hypothetical protein TURU_122170 [Turdus rufiventris]